MWLLFKLIKRPYYDSHGNVIQSIKGRRNRFGIDEFFGGGEIYPDLSSYTVLFKVETFGEWLVRIKENAPELLVKNEIKKIVVTYRITKGRNRKTYVPAVSIDHNFKDFKVKELTEIQAKNLLDKWGYRGR